MRLAHRFSKKAVLLALLGGVAVVGVTGFRTVPQVAKITPGAQTVTALRVNTAAPEMRTGTAEAVPSSKSADLAPIDLLTAMKIGGLGVSFRGNGRDGLTVTATNSTPKPMRVLVRAGLAFQSGPNLMVTMRPGDFLVAAHQTAEQTLCSAALRSTNATAELDYGFTTVDLTRFEPLLEYVTAHREVSLPAAQTALLALSENLPLRAVAKFACKGADLVSRFDTTAFKVETADLVSALQVLQNLGVPAEQIALTIDPQLRIEAMIDPLAHARAMRYYGIPAAQEWDFWKRELTQGDPGTRHYALYGIARFFPDVALQMLPRWARETKTSPVLRTAAVQALTETQRPEAASILRALAYDLDERTELGKTARLAAEYVDGRAQPLELRREVAFRSSLALGAR